MFRWLAGLGASEKSVQQALAQRDADLWSQVMQSLPCLQGLSLEEQARLEYKTAWILASKSFSAAHGMALTDHIMLSIAVQAALPILNLDTALYEGWTQVIVYPGSFLIEREVMDDAGVVHTVQEFASGEAWEGGPVILSWDDICQGPSQQSNVVIHEFAHQIDVYRVADGVPSLSAEAGFPAKQWVLGWRRAFEAFQHALERLEADIPPDVDPESEATDPWYDSLVLDPYAAEDPAEFFAVSSEAFFVMPRRLREAMPDWYGLLQRFYRQDPAQRQR